MMSESVYLNKLKDRELFLSSPIPLEISGSTGNYVATWMEGPVEGEGRTRDLAVEDCRRAIITSFNALRGRVRKSAAFSADQERQWAGLLHFIGEVRAGRIYKPGPGEEYNVQSADEEEYKGPIFG